LLCDAGLPEGKVESRPDDLLIVIRGEDEALEAAMAEVEASFNAKESGGDGEAAKIPPRSIEMAMRETPTSNLALVSTPGVYAAAEAMKALRLGLHVMMFSDNVPMEQEKVLKRYARDHELMVMGPDCGTAIINGIPLGFANMVRRGEIGLVAASGTGLQEVTCLIDRLGKGISQAIGTGGHDLSQDIGGITMLQGIEALAADPETTIIVLTSKPPAPDVGESVLAAAARCGKPIVANFLGAEANDVQRDNVHSARILEDAAHIAVLWLMIWPQKLARNPSTQSWRNAKQPNSRKGRNIFEVFIVGAPFATKRYCFCVMKSGLSIRAHRYSPNWHCAMSGAAISIRSSTLVTTSSPTAGPIR